MDVDGRLRQVAERIETIILQMHEFKVEEKQLLRQAASQLGAALGKRPVGLVAGVGGKQQVCVTEGFGYAYL